MRITDIEIQNLRGIRECHIPFPLDSRIICLIGASDSTKSTLLKAIEWVFWPTWNHTATDTDHRRLTRSDDYEHHFQLSDLLRGDVEK